MRIRTFPFVVDAVFATAVAGLAATEVVANTALRPKTAAALAEAVLVVAVAVRRGRPLLATGIAAAAAAGETFAGVPVDQPLAPLAAIVLTLYALGVHGTPRRSALGFVLVLASLTLSTKDRGLGNFVFGVVFAGGTLAAGIAMRGRVQQVQTLSREAEEERGRAIADERSRIARELHDVVAHAIALMTVQAGAAEELVRRDPARAATSARAVQDLGREALIEMGRMLGLLRETEEKDAAAPQPRLRDLPRLAQQFGDAGLPVELQVDVPGTGISPGIELSVFRIVQEALTNAVKHADATCASVVITLERDRLLIEVADDGAGSSAQGGGHGLDGMRERVSIFKGTLDTSSREGGGFVVNAELPLGPDAAR